MSSEAVSSRLQGSNIFTVAKRNVEAQDMLYQSLKLTNGIWVLAELRIQPGNPSFTVRLPAPALPALGCLLPCAGQPLLPSLLPRAGVSLMGALAQLGWGPSEPDVNEHQNSEPSFQLSPIRLPR